jgi:dTDP-4-amino-4,6-dideoxygalactose transaminase
MGLIKIPTRSLEVFKSNLDEIFETGSLAEGPWNEKLSGFARAYCDVNCAVPTASNGSGLMALLHLYKEYRGRTEVLIQSNTMYGVKTLVSSAGMTLAGFIDCNPLTLMPGFGDVARALDECDSDKATLIILLSHIGGIVNPEMDAIANLCRENGVILIEDCAHSFGATLSGRHSGAFGDAGAYSFYATKAVPAGEGGIVVTNDQEIGNALADYVKYDRFNQLMNIGVNIRLSEVQALLLYSVATEVDEIINNKRKIAARYIEACQTLGITYVDQEAEHTQGNYYKFIVLAENGNVHDTLPELKTTTSKVYDYCLGKSHIITTNHACLPIWYDQPPEVAQQVVDELEMSFARA